MLRSQESDKILKAFASCAKKLHENELLLQLSSPEEKQEMMQKLTSQFDFDEIKVFEPSLNDIFVEYAGDAE